MSDSFISGWHEVRATEGRVAAPDERLPWPQTAAMGAQHLIAMSAPSCRQSAPDGSSASCRRW